MYVTASTQTHATVLTKVVKLSARVENDHSRALRDLHKEMEEVLNPEKCLQKISF